MLKKCARRTVAETALPFIFLFLACAPRSIKGVVLTNSEGSSIIVSVKVADTAHERRD